jgi:uncharacterized protein (TIGR02118 family)
MAHTSMLKFIVVIYKLDSLSEPDFVRYFREVHGPLAEKIPGLVRYVQNFVAKDDTRKHPGWNAVIELYFSDRETMERGWKSPAGIAATDDLRAFADLTRTTWSIVEEHIVRE